MRCLAPGKLLLTGAYAVLDGFPAVVAAVDRCAAADSSLPAVRRSPEVAAALGDEPAPHVDVRSLHDEAGRKLGLGSSAAALVASLGARALARGEDPRSSSTRARIFRVAREAHAGAQGGGSGVDVAASVHGGVLRYVLDGHGGVAVRALEVPTGLWLAAYDSGTSVRTSEMLGRVASLRSHRPAAPVLGDLCRIAAEACSAFESRNVDDFLRVARAFGGALAALGRAVNAPVVPPAAAELGLLAAREGAAFFPSGAGGGDVTIWLGTSPPSAAFASRAVALSMRLLALGVDRQGVRAESSPPPAVLRIDPCAFEL